MNPRNLLLAIWLVPAALMGCAHHDTFVKADDTALGRVVVYRNGIAFYERRAKVDQDFLVLRVPADKVDDFLKSLTVRDAESGEAVPVSYPTAGSSSGSTVDMTIQLPPGRTHDVLLTYITEAPAWKPSYRIVVQDNGTVGFQGWAIVDNTSGEDWEAVRVGVGSSSALSFRYDLRSVQNVHRETLGGAHRFAQAPPGGGSVHRVDRTTRTILAQVGDKHLPLPPGHPEAVYEMGEASVASQGVLSGGGARIGSSMESNASAPPRRERKRRDMRRVHALAKQIKDLNGKVVLEGYASRGEEDADDSSLDRANRLRNELIAQGVAPGRLQVKARGHVKGKAGGVELKVTQSGRGTADEGQPDGPVGESHFESTTPMTIARGTSAMVSMVNTDTPGEVVYLYAPDAKRGDERYAFRAVRFQNPTDSSLESGPVTVYGQGRFVGEGLTETVPAGATTLVPFALDRQIVVERSGATEDRIARLTKVNKGICTAEILHTRRTVLEITNRLSTEALVYVRHDVPDGWHLEESPGVSEKLGESHLFQIPMKAGETRKVVIAEATPLTRTIDLRSVVGVDLIRTHLSASSTDPTFGRAMAGLLAIHDEVARNEEMIASLQERTGEYRLRLNELHIQIATLRLVKAGNSLLKHLRSKMTDMSNRVQKATIDIVNHQEQLMLARIRFQDGMSELTLERTTIASKSDG